MKSVILLVSSCLVWLGTAHPFATAAAPQSQLYIMFADHEQPVLAMHKTEGDGRLVTAADLKRITNAKIRWNEDEADQLKQLKRFPNLKSVTVGRCNLRFPSLKHLSELRLTSLDADRCKVTPDMLHMLKEFPELESISIDFGLNGIRVKTKALEIKELEVLRQLPNLRHLSVSGWGVSRIAMPRFCGHSKLESLDLHLSSVTAKGEFRLDGLPSLRHLRLPDLKDVHVAEIVKLPALESLTADGGGLTVEGFRRLAGISKLQKLSLHGFWSPEPEIEFLRHLNNYNREELQVVMAIHVLLRLAKDEKDEKDLKGSRVWANEYAAIIMGTEAEPTRRDAAGRPITFVEQAFNEQGTIASIRRSIAQEAIRAAQASHKEKPRFYARVHYSVEALTGLKFARPNPVPLPLVDQELPSLTNSLGMQFRKIPAGGFVHVDKNGNKSTAEITKPFHLAVLEVTQSQFSTVMDYNPSGMGIRNMYDRTVELPLRDDNLPVNNITAYEGMKFCWQLSQVEEEKSAGRSYRLPTEQEWELACRAGTTMAFHFGGTGDYTPKLANLAPRTFRYEFPTTKPQPVGSYPPNEFGIFDMHGNVSEPCMDAVGKWVSSTDYVRIGKGPNSHVYRGAGYLTPPKKTGSSSREFASDDIPFEEGGLRVVCVVGQSSELSQKILAVQHRWFDPSAREIDRAIEGIKKASKKIAQGDIGSYLGRALEFAKLGKHEANPNGMFEKAKADLAAFRPHMDDVFDRIKFGEVGHEVSVIAAEKYEELKDTAAAARWWKNANTLANLAVEEGRKLIDKSRAPSQRRGQLEQLGRRILKLASVLDKMGRSDDAIARLNQEIRRYPTLMMLYQRRAELKEAAGDHDGAIEDFALALKANPKRFEKALIDWKQEREDWGFLHFDKLMEQRAAALEQIGRSDAAIKQRAAIAKLRNGEVETVP